MSEEKSKFYWTLDRDKYNLVRRMYYLQAGDFYTKYFNTG